MKPSRLVLVLATLATACNGLLGNDAVSFWEPHAAPLGAKDGGDSAQTPDAAASPLDASAPDGSSPPTPPPVGIALQLVSDYSGTCIDVGTSKQSGSVLSLTVCQNLGEQLLVLKDAGASYSIFNPNSGKCVAVEDPDGGVANGTGLELQDCSDASAQLFKVQGSTGAYFFISRIGDFVCLDDGAFQASSGAPVVVWGCNGGSNQKWSLVQ